MIEEELFQRIDNGIDSFKKAEGYQKGIKISKDPHSDWLIFNWRQLTWEENGIEYLIEVFPNFDEKENISSWTMYAAASYDLDRKRFNLKKILAEKTSLEIIADNIDQLLVSGYKLITCVPKREIPFAVDLK